ncbi:hypothetical protein [Salinicola rhizosphaerae]|uniref:Uncharacterized protein n=1 Tax=Salinicola rhizosphaerae TaxID=1443141 RepID=A0ABQ3EGP5_9GAMM|nr:hypothetical protein [Salinicola rhizosphaerae]GHB30270.1 hypothetical protein GCM10009038_31300 [Salinicola rhizosphaerae]
MKKGLLTATITSLILLGATGTAMAQSAAMEDAYDATDEPLAQGDGVTASGESTDMASGHSAATNESMDAVSAETQDVNNATQTDDLDELNASGHSDAAAEAIESQ